MVQIWLSQIPWKCEKPTLILYLFNKCGYLGGFGRPILLCRGKMTRPHGMAAYVRDGYGAFRQPKFECGCCEMQVFRVCGVRQNLYVYSLYCNPDLDDRIFDCLLASTAAVQAEDVRASFLFVGDLNSHHQ